VYRNHVPLLKQLASKRPTHQKKTPNGVSNAKKPPAPANLVDDFSALFGGKYCKNISIPAIGYTGLAY
jgi:hypothetical protein